VCECFEPCQVVVCTETEHCVVNEDNRTGVCQALSIDPQIEDMPVSVELYKAGRLVLPCKVSGQPAPTISWFKDRHEITFEAFDDRLLLGQDGTLNVGNVSEADAGVYSCRASSLGKSVVKETRVVVKGKEWSMKT